MFNDYFYTRLQYILPKHLLSSLAGIITNCQVPWFKNWLIDKFIAHYKVDMRCALETNPHNYSNFNHFFTRHLKPEARPIVATENAIACPVDGTVSQIGMIQDNYLPQAKGFTYSVQQLLGGSKERAAPFLNGHFTTLYLAPKDYHRVHMPLSGQLREMIYIPGQLFSVNPTTANHIPNLFASNERVVSLFDTPAGPMAIILVGATLVASIVMVWAGIISPPRGKQIITWQYTDKNIHLARGAEMGHFQLGSTVIVLFAPNRTGWVHKIQTGSTVCMGQELGNVCV